MFHPSVLSTTTSAPTEMHHLRHVKVSVDASRFITGSTEPLDHRSWRQKKSSNPIEAIFSKEQCDT